MRILVVGNGGREHAIAWKLSSSNKVKEVWVAPGNAGTASVAHNLPNIVPTNVAALVDVIHRHDIDLVVIGPENVLEVDAARFLKETGVAVIGPSAREARLETSKSYCKKFLTRYEIPTAIAQELHDFTELQAYLRLHSGTVVLKMDGLAQGKGVIESADTETLTDFGKKALEHGPLLAEEHLTGYELSLFLLLDGENYISLPICSDFKKANDGDLGPNTGGMGAICPVPFENDELKKEIKNQITIPIVRGLRQEGLMYEGVLFVGLMITETGPQVLEFNVRLGDPESQVILPVISNDFGELLEQMTTGALKKATIAPNGNSAVTVVIAAAGYPKSYKTGLAIKSLPENHDHQGVIFHASTSIINDTLYTGGGRSFSVTGLGEDLSSARDNAYTLSRQIHFPGAWYRTDIGNRFISWQSEGTRAR